MGWWLGWMACGGAIPLDLGVDRDGDGDGLTDLEEVEVYLTDPTRPDTDGDGWTDGREVGEGTDPRLEDTDADGLLDPDESRLETDPLDPDTDDDELLDGFERRVSANPTEPDTDRDGLLDGDEVRQGSFPNRWDSDNDGLSDPDELDELGTDPRNPDTDDDGLSDREEVQIYETDPLLEDTDEGGVWDQGEVIAGTDPNDGGDDDVEQVVVFESFESTMWPPLWLPSGYLRLASGVANTGDWAVQLTGGALSTPEYDLSRCPRVIWSAAISRVREGETFRPVEIELRGETVGQVVVSLEADEPDVEGQFVEYSGVVPPDIQAGPFLMIAYDRTIVVVDDDPGFILLDDVGFRCTR